MGARKRARAAGAEGRAVRRDYEHYDDERCGAPIGDVVQTMLAEPNFDITEVVLVLRKQYFGGAIYQSSDTTIGEWDGH